MKGLWPSGLLPGPLWPMSPSQKTFLGQLKAHRNLLDNKGMMTISIACLLGMGPSLRLLTAEVR